MPEAGQRSVISWPGDLRERSVTRPSKLRHVLRSTVLRRLYVSWQHRGLDEGDVFLASYPKSGNTWLKFMLGQLLTEKDVDFDTAEELMPSVGRHLRAPRLLPSGGRLLKTHEPYRAAYTHAIYLVRDGRDVAVSYYHHVLRTGVFSGPFEAFFDRFLAGRVHYGTWDNQVRSWLDSPIAGTDRLCIVQYEAMKKDAVGTLRRITASLGLQATESQLRHVVGTNTVQQMRAKEASSTRVLNLQRGDIPVVREGKAGGWRSALSPAQKRAFLNAAGETLLRLGYPAD